MFIGHFAVAFAVKRVAPQAKLGTAMLAASFLDVLWPLFLIAGVEVVKIVPGATAFTPLRFVSYPFSHSLTMAALWAVVFGVVYRWRRGSSRTAIWLGVLVVSHWFLDLFVHDPDLQLFPELDIYVGLGLWNSVAGTLIVEGVMFAAGIALYLSATHPRDRVGTWALVGLVALLLASYAAAAFGPPPPSIEAIVVADLVGTAIAVAWGYWVDRHREVVVPLK
jgi:hypothetical protein